MEFRSRADLTIAVDVATRSICAAVLRPVGTKAVDASLVLAKIAGARADAAGLAVDAADVGVQSYRTSARWLPRQTVSKTSASRRRGHAEAPYSLPTQASGASPRDT